MQIFGHMPDGHAIREVTIHSKSGAVATIMEWGAVLRDMQVPKPGGGVQRVVLGLNTLADYLAHSPHFGATAGRFANRIGGGQFTLDGKRHQLPLNQAGKHSLHGGGPGLGFGARPWTILNTTENSVTLGLVSPDSDAGYPGAVNVQCRYTLAEPAILRVELSASTDKATIINLCHHSYFNLDGGADILDHTLMLRANVWTPVSEDLIPDGTLQPVAQTPLDFRVARAVRHLGDDGSRFWYDHNFILRRDHEEPSVADGLRVAHAATLASAKSGLAMEVWTTEPAIQFYDGFKVAVPVEGLGGTRYGANAGLCLEPQHVPDSPNLPHFPSTTLRPGELYRQVTEYRFS
ncbi:MAG: aldose epimerase family protein [Beijerinckiaceae bacterium]